MHKRCAIALFVFGCSRNGLKSIVPLNDAQIVGVSAALSNGELAAALVAQKKATTASVKALAQTVIDTHAQSTEREQQLSITSQASAVSAEIERRNTETLALLNQSATAPANSGPDARGSVCAEQTESFDCVYVRAQLALQSKAISEIDSELLPQTRDAYLGAALQEMRLSLETQLAVATTLAAVPTASGGGNTGGGGQTGSTGSTSGGSTGTASGGTSGTSSGSSSGASSGSSSGNTS